MHREPAANLPRVRSILLRLIAHVPVDPTPASARPREILASSVVQVISVMRSTIRLPSCPAGGAEDVIVALACSPLVCGISRPTAGAVRRRHASQCTAVIGAVISPGSLPMADVGLAVVATRIAAIAAITFSLFAPG